MIFRLKVSIPVILLAFAVWSLRHQISSPIIQSKLEDRLPGLNIRDLELNPEAGLLGLKASAAYSDDLGTLASLAKLELKIEKEPLGFGDLVATGNIEDLRLSRRLFFEEKLHPKVEAAVGGNSTVVERDDSSFSLDSLDHREVLERFTGQRSLETEKKIEEARKLIKKMESRWLPRQQELKQQIESFRRDRSTWTKNWERSLNIDPLLNRAKELKREARDLKNMKFSGVDLVQIATNLQKIQNFQLKVTELQSLFRKTRSSAKEQLSMLSPLGKALSNPQKLSRELKRDLEQLKNLKTSLEDSTKSDIALLKKELDPRSFNSSKTVRLIMGRGWELKFKSALDLLDSSLGPLLSSIKPDEDASDEVASHSSSKTAPSGIPQEVIFPRHFERPRWTISSLRYAGYAKEAFENADLRFEGVLRNLSSNEKLSGSAPECSAMIYLPGKGGSLHLDMIYSLSHNTPDQRLMKVKLKGRPLAGTEMGATNSKLIFQAGTWGLNGTIDLSSAPHWKFRGEILWHQAEFVLGPGVKKHLRAPLQGAAKRLLTKPVAFNYQYPNTLRFEGDFEDWIGPIFSDAIASLASYEQGLLAEKIQARLSPKLGDIFKDGELQGLLNTGMPLLLKGAMGEKRAFEELLLVAQSQLSGLLSEEELMGERLSEVLGLKKAGKKAQGSLEDRLKEEAKRKLQDLAAKKLKEQLFGKLGDDNEGNQETKSEKDSDEDPKEILKEELKNELKDALRNFPF